MSRRVEISPDYARNINPLEIAQIELTDGTIVRVANKTFKPERPRRSPRRAPPRGSARRSLSGGRRRGSERMSFGKIIKTKKNYNLYEGADLTRKMDEEESPRPRPKPKEKEVYKKQKQEYGQVIKEKRNYNLYESGVYTEKVKEKKVEKKPAPVRKSVKKYKKPAVKKPEPPCTCNVCPICQRERQQPKMEEDICPRCKKCKYCEKCQRPMGSPAKTVRRLKPQKTMKPLKRIISSPAILRKSGSVERRTRKTHIFRSGMGSIKNYENDY